MKQHCTSPLIGAEKFAVVSDSEEEEESSIGDDTISPVAIEIPAEVWAMVLDCEFVLLLHVVLIYCILMYHGHSNIVYFLFGSRSPISICPIGCGYLTSNAGRCVTSSYNPPHPSFVTASSGSGLKAASRCPMC